MSRRNSLLAGAVAGLCALGLLLVTAGPIGVTWDEPIYSVAAENAAHWLGLVAHGDLARAFEQYTFGVSWGLVNEHPPLVRILNGLGWTLTRHVLALPTAQRAGSMALAGVAVGVLVAACARRYGLLPGLFAGAAVFTMPRLFFHAHLGALDFPLAATWLLATLAFYRAMHALRWWSPLLIGLGLGLALLTKINGVLLIPFWAAWLLLYHRSWRALACFLMGLPVALVVLIAGWPWIWKDPVPGLINWIQFFRVHFEIRQWFAGQLYLHTPWYLPAAMVLVTTPLLLLALAFAGSIWDGTGTRSRTGGRGFAPRRPGEWTGLHLLGILTVLGYYALPITAIHDQERLLLPAFLHLATLAAGGYAVVASWLSGVLSRTLEVTPGGVNSPPKSEAVRLRALLQPPSLAAGARLLLGLLCVLPGAVAIARLHPFELAYYNELVGGVPGAPRLNLETIYFASTYAHFLPDLNRLPAGSKVWVMPNSWDVLYYYQQNGMLDRTLVLLRPPGWGSFYDGAGVLHAEGGLESADFALIERRQTTFNAVIPEYAIQLTWADSKPALAQVTRDSVILAGLYSR